MPYWLESDTFHDDPIWTVLSGGKLRALNDLQAAYARLKSAASHARTDGYLAAPDALRYCGYRRILDRLCDAVLDQAPLLHRRGDKCPCLGADWIDGYEFRIHEFLKRNPSRRENDRNKAQKADLKDPRLKTLAYERDGGCCRYCRSGPVSEKAGKARDRRRFRQFDHVDPDQPGGANAENFVTACAVCNEYKGHRTPAEAEMLLLPAPAPDLAAQWLAREEPVLADRPPYRRADQLRITDEITAGSATDHRSITDPVTDPTTDGKGDPDTEPTNGATGDVCSDQDDHPSASAPSPPGKGAGSGRGAARDGGAPPPPTGVRDSPNGQPIRAPDSPDVYTGRSRSPTTGDDP